MAKVDVVCADRSVLDRPVDAKNYKLGYIIDPVDVSIVLVLQPPIDSDPRLKLLLSTDETIELYRLLRNIPLLRDLRS